MYAKLILINRNKPNMYKYKKIKSNPVPHFLVSLKKSVVFNFGIHAAYGNMSLLTLYRETYCMFIVTIRLTGNNKCKV